MQIDFVSLQLGLIQTVRPLGDHVLAAVTGRSHEIAIKVADDYRPNERRPILVGRATGTEFTGRWTEENSSQQTLRKRHRAKKVQLLNLTPHPVRLTEYASKCSVKSRGPVQDQGTNNRFDR